MPLQKVLNIALLIIGLLVCESCQLYVQNPSGTLILSNLDSDNWIYGGSSPEEYKKLVFDQIISAKNIVKCNLFFPFFNGSNCVECPDQQFFNLSEKKCVECPNGITDHECSN